MQILDNFLIFAIHVLCFYAGMKIADKYHNQAAREQKTALQRQYARLQVRADADDPVQPYGDYDGDEKIQLVDQNFMDRLKKTGKAAIRFNKADIAK